MGQIPAHDGDDRNHHGNNSGHQYPLPRGPRRLRDSRIPAVVTTRTPTTPVTTPAPTLLAFCEGRVDSAADHGHIDIVLKRSTDGGRTWGPLQAVARNGNDLAGNPAPVVLDTGRILLVHVAAAGATEDAILRGRVKPADGRRVWVQHSDDDGVTWSAPKEITGQVKKAGWRWYATAPGHAVQLGTGRVVVPGNHTLPPTGTDTGTETKYNSGHCLLSDDRGETWSLGYVDENTDGHVNANETTAAELPDGRVYFNTRNDSPSPATVPTPTPRTAAALVKPFGRRRAWSPPSSRAACCRLATPTCCCTRGRPTPPPALHDRPGLRRRRHHLAARVHGRRTARRLLRPRPCRRGDGGACCRRATSGRTGRSPSAGSP